MPLRLSLRTLMFFVLACGLGWVVQRARVQRDAVAAIHAAGGEDFHHQDWPESRRHADH